MTPAGPDRAALGLNALGVGVALALVVLVEQGGSAVLAAAGLAALLLAAGCLSRFGPASSLMARGGALLAAGVALATALTPGAAIWPGAIAAGFASRVLAEDNEIRLGELWSRPEASFGAVQIQSAASAAALAVGLALVGLWALPFLPERAGGQVGDLMLAALRGGTPVHAAVLAAFALALGFLCDAAILHARDRSGFAAALAAGGAGRALELLPGATLARIAPGLAMSGAAATGAPSWPWSAGEARIAAARALRDGTRRFMRQLLALLPLIGFLGTVVGLSAAIGALPHDLAQGAGRVDIAGTVGGLAVKFETTLLGLAGAVVGALGLGWLERSEGAFLARAVLRLEGAREAGGR